MTDQAEALRKLMQIQKSKLRIVTVTSGKGGVGKSSLALNLAIALRRRGHRPMIIDSDFGFSNIDVMLGVRTQYDLTDVIEQRRQIRDVVQVGLEGVQFISGGSGVYKLTKMSQQQLMRIVESLLELEDLCDVIIFDTGAGISDNSLRLIHASHDTILVTTPEPTSVVDAYALLKIVHEQGIRPNVSLVVNQAESVKEGISVLDGLASIAEKNTRMAMKKLGVVQKDENMQIAVKEQVPILISHPVSGASRDINGVAVKFLDLPQEVVKKSGLAGFFERLMARSGTA